MGKNNAQFIDANALKDIKTRNKKGDGQKKIAKEYNVSPTTISFAIRANSVAEFKKMLKERTDKEVAARRDRKAAKKQNDKAQDVAAEKVKSLGYAYTPKQVKQLIDGLVEHTNNLEERVQTLTSLVVANPEDNLVTRVYKLEGKKPLLRRFLDKF